MKLYTRKGDRGYTSLFGGRAVRKDDPRVDAYGTVDELNAVIGWAAAACEVRTVRARLIAIQRELFRIGAALATAPAPPASISRSCGVGPRQVRRLERWIDEAWEGLPPLNRFILPGGSEGAARLHIARTVCRRAERLVVEPVVGDAGARNILVYLNRLGDLLFAWARLVNYLGGVADVTWQGSTRSRAGRKSRNR